MVVAFAFRFLETVLFYLWSAILVARIVVASHRLTGPERPNA